MSDYSLMPFDGATCDWGDCDRRAVSYRYDDKLDRLLAVCRRHILAYKVCDGRWWQAEDEYCELRFCRRSRLRWLAQRLLLSDQRAALAGRVSRGQRRLIAARGERS